MRRVVVWVLVAVTVVLVGVGIWWFVRDEYPFGVDAEEIAAMSYERSLAGVAVGGYVSEPPRDLAGWLSAMERDSTGEDVATTGAIMVYLHDGRCLRLELDGSRGVGTWIAPDGSADEPVGVHVPDQLVRYLDGLDDGLTAIPLPGSQAPHAASPTASP